MIFTIVSLLAIIFLMLYYITPNNYIIHTDINNYTIKKDLFYNILPNQTITIKNNNYVIFNIEQNIIIKNVRKYNLLR